MIDVAKQVQFFHTREDAEPVREWLQSMPEEDRRRGISDTVGRLWQKVDDEGLLEARTKLSDREVRVIFFVVDENMILTHGFVKKGLQTPPAALRLARNRMRQWWLRQVAQSGYDIFVFQDGGLLRVTDENASELGVYATERDRDADAGDIVLGRIYLNLEPRRASDFYVVYTAAWDSEHVPRELGVNRMGAGGDTVYANGFGYMFCRSYESGHAIRLGGVGNVYRKYGDGHAIRYDGAGQLQGGECYDLIRRHLSRISHIAQVNADAPEFDPGHGNIERCPEHEGIAFRGGDGPGMVRGDNRRDDRPAERRKLPPYHYYNWPSNKEEREKEELKRFIRSWSASNPSIRPSDLVCVRRSERPDCIIRNQRTGDEYGVELTSVYLDEKSVIDYHRMMRSELEPWLLLHPPEIRRYLHCIADKVEEKVDKAQSYDKSRELILSVHLNERILSPEDFKSELQNFMRGHPAFRRIAPFVDIIFSGIGNGVRWQPTMRPSGR